MTKSLLTLLSKLPLPVLRSIARFAAWVVCQQKLPKLEDGVRGKGLRWRVRVNSYIAYPQLSKNERDTFEKACIKNQFMAIVEALKCWGYPPSYSVSQITQVHHQDALTDALKNPNGMIAVVLHMGTWEMMNAWLNQFGAPTIMYKPMKDEAINAFMLKGRERIQATLVPTDTSGIKAIFKTLKQGGFTIILPDHKPDTAGSVYAPLYAANTSTSTIVSKLASKTNCALIGLTCLRREGAKGFEVYCDAMTDDALWSKNVEVAAAALNQQIESMINRAPAHYIWSYERFGSNTNFKRAYSWSERKLIAHFVEGKEVDVIAAGDV